MRTFACILAGAINIAAWAQVAPTSAPTQSGAPSPNGVKPAAQPAAEPKPASQPVPRRPIQEILDSRVPEVDFRDAPLEKVMEWVERQTGAMVYVRWSVLADVGIERDAPITVKARDRRLSQILWVILNEAEGSTGVTLAYEATDELLLFSTDRDLSGKLVTHTYDVLDAAHDVPKYTHPGMLGGGIVFRTHVRRAGAPQPRPIIGTSGTPTPTPAAAPPPARTEVQTDDEKLQEFMELIQTTIEPDSWAVNGGEGVIFPHKGRLIIRASIRVHRLIESAFQP